MINDELFGHIYQSVSSIQNGKFLNSTVSNVFVNIMTTTHGLRRGP